MDNKKQTYETKIKKWGNSLALRLPKNITKKLNLNEDTPVDILFNNKDLQIKPRNNKKYSLEELVNKIDNKNIHSESLKDNPIGKEVW